MSVNDYKIRKALEAMSNAVNDITNQVSATEAKDADASKKLQLENQALKEQIEKSISSQLPRFKPIDKIVDKRGYDAYLKFYYEHNLDETIRLIGLDQEESRPRNYSGYSSGQATAEQNANVDIFNKYVNVFESLGFKKSDWILKTSRSRRKHQIEQQWYAQLKSLLHSANDNGWNEFYNLLEGHKTKLRAFDQDVKNKSQAIREKEAAIAKAAASQKRMENYKQLAYYMVKYNCDDMASAKQVLAIVIGSNKYLMLGHFLHANVLDFSDGYDKAQYGLSKFEVKSQQDREIFNDINEGIIKWDGDPKCFKNNDWSYDALFELVLKSNPGLMADYEKLTVIAKEISLAEND